MIVALLVSLAVTQAAVGTAQSPARNPYEVLACAERINRAHPLSDIRRYLDAVLAGEQPQPIEPCVTDVVGPERFPTLIGAWRALAAELFKSVGDARAGAQYELAIEADRDEAAYRLFYADYLRNFRGPQQPLFPESERQYLAGQSTIERRAAAGRKTAWDSETASRLARGLVALHERDGAPAFWRGREVPAVFLASVFRASRAAVDLDRSSDVRDYTAAAALAQSRQGVLPDLQLRALIHDATPADSFSRMRLRFKTAPVVDLFFNHRYTGDVAPTVYRAPFRFNRLKLDTLGIGIEKPFTLGQAVDVAVGASFQSSSRLGLVEYLPDVAERINEGRGHVTMSKFVNRDRVTVTGFYARQSIQANVAGAAARVRDFVGSTVAYEFFRPSTFRHRFDTRGIEVSAGVLSDRETYPDAPRPEIVVRRFDYFGGVSARGLAAGRFDVTFKPSVFSSDVSPDASQRNAQYRSTLVPLYRIVDPERQPGIPGFDVSPAGLHLASLTLAFPVSRDVALSGSDFFCGESVGVALYTTWYAAHRPGTTFLGTFQYDVKRFYVARTTRHLFSVGLSVGF